MIVNCNVKVNTSPTCFTYYYVLFSVLLSSLGMVTGKPMGLTYIGGLKGTGL